MNVRVSLLALLIFVSPVMATQEEQSTNGKNRLRAAVITIASIVAGAFLAYNGYRYYGNVEKVNESEKQNQLQEALTALQESNQRLDSMLNQLIENQKQTLQVN